ALAAGFGPLGRGPFYPYVAADAAGAPAGPQPERCPRGRFGYGRQREQRPPAADLGRRGGPFRPPVDAALGRLVVRHLYGGLWVRHQLRGAVCRRGAGRVGCSVVPSVGLGEPAGGGGPL